VIEALDVSKKFRISEDRSRSIKETAINFLKGKKRSFREVPALRNINFRIREGESVAFIGENGSGKSTLLKLLYGIYVPDGGKIITKGRVSALLELGVGFHPDLTGEENIFLNGSMLGFNHKEMRERFEEIVSFSEIGDFVYSPIRTYSSGMWMRLGFSVAMCVDPDILLIDEVLAVGDEAFQKKCLDRLEEFKSAGKTIVIVSHALSMVQKFCDRIILLHEGQIVVDGEPERTIERYRTLLSLGVEAEATDKIEEAQNSAEEVEENPLLSNSCEGVEEVPVEVVEESPEKGQEEISDREEREIKLDLKRVRIIEVQDSLLFAGKLFQDAFGDPPPAYPNNYIAICEDSQNPSTFHVVGFVHLQPVGEMGLVAGLCVDRQWRGKGLGKMLLTSMENQDQWIKALFVYAGDPRIPAECGYESLSHPHLMAKWIGPLSPEKKEKMINIALAIGPF
jgi:ABC-type polysaccharide/polyol phosphate transport system ATPase subunit/ribosomal protein S18 acetylase RimI-like enzyme